jgi:Flp pilus assembly pilin Flp
MDSMTTTLRHLLSGDRRGAVSTEYVVLMGAVGIGVVFALVAVGPTLVKDFETTRTVIAAPFP